MRNPARDDEDDGAPSASPVGCSSSHAMRLAAQKSRALARGGGGHLPIADTDDDDPRAVTGKVGQLSSLRRERTDFQPGNRRQLNSISNSDSRSAPSYGGSAMDYALQLSQDSSPKDALAQLIKERDTGGWGASDDLEAKRRAVPGLVPSYTSDPDQRGAPQQSVTSQLPPRRPWGNDTDHQPVPRHSMPERRHNSMPEQRCAGGLGTASSNVWAKGNAGNMITDRPTSRVLKPPGGGSSFVVGQW